MLPDARRCARGTCRRASTRLPSSGWSSVSASKRMPLGVATHRHRDARLVDRRRRRDVEVEHATAPSAGAAASAVHASGIEALEVGEAPVLVARRRQRERLVALEELSSHAARSGGGASGRCRRGRWKNAMWQTPGVERLALRTRRPSPRARRGRPRRRRRGARGARSSAARTPARRSSARRSRSTGSPTQNSASPVSSGRSPSVST